MEVLKQDYIGGVEYKNSAVEAVYHEHGRLYKKPTAWQYEYTLADHLGNSRITFSDTSGIHRNGKIFLWMKLGRLIYKSRQNFTLIKKVMAFQQQEMIKQGYLEVQALTLRRRHNSL